MPGTPGSSWVVPVFIGVTAVAIGGSVYYSWASNKKRNAAFRALATTMGFTYEEDEYARAALFTIVGLEHAPLFNRGHSRKAQRMLQGRLADRGTQIFDYTYTTGSGKSAHVHRQSVVRFPDGAKGLPDFDLSPESVFHALVEIFGAQDIDFTENAEFSKRYLLRGQDEAAIRKAFTSNALAWFSGAPGWRVQTHQGTMVIFREGKLVEPAEIPAYAAEALRILGLFPRA